MQDIRLERWAHTLVHYSLYLKPGETVAIRTTPLAAPLVEAVYREVLHAGAHPLDPDPPRRHDHRAGPPLRYLCSAGEMKRYRDSPPFIYTAGSGPADIPGPAAQDSRPEVTGDLRCHGRAVCQDKRHHSGFQEGSSGTVDSRQQQYRV